MHSIAASTEIRNASSGLMRWISSFRVVDDSKAPFAFCHFSKKGDMSVVRSLITGRFAIGPILICPSCIIADTRVRQVQQGRPLMVIAQEPHMPTRHAKRYDRVGSILR